MLRRGNRVTAAALAILILGVTAGLGPGKHTCVPQASPPASGLRVEPATEADHLEHGDVFCVACLLKGQFNSLSLSVVPRVPPPQQSLVVGTSQVLLGNVYSRLHWDARAPPYAPSDSGTP